MVDDSVITMNELNTLTEQTAPRLLRQYQEDPQALDKQFRQLQTANLDRLIERQLILHDFKTGGYAPLPQSLINDLVQERIKQDFGDRATLTKTLEARGMTFETFRDQVRERFIVEALRSKYVSSEIIISPHKIQEYYAAHRNDFKVEDQVKVRVIVLKKSDDTNAPPAERLAEEIHRKLQQGASFEDMAKIYSQGTARGQGGDWGWQNKSEMTPGLADVAYSLGVGKVSGVFSRTYGDNYWVYRYDEGRPTMALHYGVDGASDKQALLEKRAIKDGDALTSLPEPKEFYLMKVEDSRPAHFKSLSEVRTTIESTLLIQEQDRLEKQWLEKLRKKTFVKLY